MKIFLKVFSVFCLLFSCYGCAAILLGAGVLGGMAISDDTVQSYIDKNLDSLWKISVDVLTKVGSIEEKDKDKGIIKASVEKSNVTLKFEMVTEKTTRLKITARKIRNLLPDIKLAASINNLIVKRSDKKEWH